MGRSYIPGGFPVCAYDIKDRLSLTPKVAGAVQVAKVIGHLSLLKLSCDWSNFKGNRANAAMPRDPPDLIGLIERADALT